MMETQKVQEGRGKMRKKVTKRVALLACVLLITAGAGLHIPQSGRGTLSVTRKIYAGIVIRQLEESIEFKGDLVTLQNGRVHSFQIGSHESAELLYNCIRNAARLNDYSDACLAPQETPILVNERCGGTFGMIYYTLPMSGRFIGFQFRDEDEEKLHGYVMAAAEEMEKDGSAIYIE